MAQRAHTQTNPLTQYIDNNDEVPKQIVTTTKTINLDETDHENNDNQANIQYVPLQDDNDQKYSNHIINTMLSESTNTLISRNTCNTIPYNVSSKTSHVKSTSNTATLSPTAASFTPKGHSNKPSHKCKHMDTISEQKVSTSTPCSPKMIHMIRQQKLLGLRFLSERDIQRKHRCLPNKLRCCSVSVSKKFSQTVIPQTIAEEIHDAYVYMDKAMAFNDNKLAFRYKHYDGTLIAVNFDLHHIKSKEPLFCIIEETSGCKTKWRMRDQLFTEQNMIDQFGIPPYQLPSSLRVIRPHTGNDIALKQEMIGHTFTNTKWSDIPLHCKKKSRQRRVLHMTNKEFIATLQQIQIDKIHQMPILSVNDGVISVEKVMIIHLSEDRSIGISYKIDSISEKMIITGIYLDKNMLLTWHELAVPSHTPHCHCLDNFKTNIDELKIGNVYEEQNQINALRQANQEMRKENKSPVIRYLKGVINDAGAIITKNTKIALSAIKKIFNVHTIKNAIHNYLDSKHPQHQSSLIPLTDGSNSQNNPMSYITTICGSYATTTPLPPLKSSSVT